MQEFATCWRRCRQLQISKLGGERAGGSVLAAGGSMGASWSWMENYWGGRVGEYSLIRVGEWGEGVRTSLRDVANGWDFPALGLFFECSQVFTRSD